MAVSKAQAKATAKFESKAYDKILLRLPKGEREKYKEIAENRGLSLNAWVIELMKKAAEKKAGE